MSLETSISTEKINLYLTKQLNCFFPDNQEIKSNDLFPFVQLALGKVEYCFLHVNLPYYKKKNHPYFNHLNSDHFCIFLCFLARVVFVKSNNEHTASKIFLLNKLLFGIDAFYEIELPDIFIVVHPIGTILGRADYKNGLVIYQGVTVGATTEGIYPVFSENTILYSNSSLIGKCKLGKNFTLGANSSLFNAIIEDNMTVVGTYPKHRVLKSKNIIKHYFI